MITKSLFLARVVSLIGVTPYVFGGASPAGTDCSGLPYWADYEQIPRTSQDQYAGLPHLNTPQLGCLVFFSVASDSGDPPQHVGIWIAPNLMIEAPHTGELVKYSAIPNEYPEEYVIGYALIPFLPEPQPLPPTAKELAKMQMTFDLEGNAYVVAAGLGANPHLQIFTLPKGGFNLLPKEQKWSIIDVTDNIKERTGDEFYVAP